MKPAVLTFVRRYLPGYKSGGPLRTISNMVDRMGDEYEFRIVTSDRDASDTRPYGSVTLNAWNLVGRAEVLYLPRSNRTITGFRRLLRDTAHDVVYLNSFFDPEFSLRPLLALKLQGSHGAGVIVAPRGELSPGALGLKAWKKLPYLWLARHSAIYRECLWQASSAFEAAEIRSALAGVREATFASERDDLRVFVAPNLVARIPDETAVLKSVVRPTGPPIRACFLSRITRKKNLDYALRALALVQAPVQFSIYGPIEDEDYWAECQSIARKLPRHVEVRYNGTVLPADVIPTLATHHLFFFPTRGENFGHVIHEALRAGLALLVSDQTPWRNLQEAGVGWDLPLDDPGAFARRVDEVGAWSGETLKLVTAKARAWARRTAHDEAVLDANRRMFESAIHRKTEGHRPGKRAADARTAV
jgi:glycosyltransferase involved in cell wall biosynthesis